MKLIHVTSGWWHHDWRHVLLNNKMWQHVLTFFWKYHSDFLRDIFLQMISLLYSNNVFWSCDFLFSSPLVPFKKDLLPIIYCLLFSFQSPLDIIKQQVLDETLANYLMLLIFYRKLSIADNMIKIMEKYSKQLEETVESRTAQLEEERKKTELLLGRMLPE